MLVRLPNRHFVYIIFVCGNKRFSKICSYMMFLSLHLYVLLLFCYYFLDVFYIGNLCTQAALAFRYFLYSIIWLIILMCKGKYSLNLLLSCGGVGRCLRKNYHPGPSISQLVSIGWFLRSQAICVQCLGRFSYCTSENTFQSNLCAHTYCTVHTLKFLLNPKITCPQIKTSSKNFY